MVKISNHNLSNILRIIINNVSIVDMHTHLYGPDFDDLLLWGIDELLNYHYLYVEFFRIHNLMDYNTFYSMNKAERADLIWKTLFVDNTPISESCIGVITVLNELSIDFNCRNLNSIRAQYNTIDREKHIDLVFGKTNIKYVVMTNDIFEDREHNIWKKNKKKRDKRFKGSLRVDTILNNYLHSFPKLFEWGYHLQRDLCSKSVRELKRFFEEWIDITESVYVNTTIGPEFIYPDDSIRTKILDKCLFPTLIKKRIPISIMLGVRKNINPLLREGGNSLGKINIEYIENLLRNYSNVRFFVTCLSRENNHELCVLARKFKNLTPFGCWWFLNNPMLINEITKMRIEMLGTSFIFQHSDSRVLDQLIYKWAHSKEVLFNILFERYSKLINTGWVLTKECILSDINKLLNINFEKALYEKL
ncbi:hypothetical protein MHK_001541 [Candidatus Magnetomorum sp. HK-1]|nr:hypothetical protein MHK_001541 [Candidatus Magnetomorum sp. HK-1]